MQWSRKCRYMEELSRLMKWICYCSREQNFGKWLYGMELAAEEDIVVGWNDGELERTAGKKCLGKSLM
jgi:hypothetical protein